jgi:hypothetical protein
VNRGVTAREERGRVADALTDGLHLRDRVGDDGAGEVEITPRRRGNLEQRDRWSPGCERSSSIFRRRSSAALVFTVTVRLSSFVFADVSDVVIESSLLLTTVAFAVNSLLKFVTLVCDARVETTDVEPVVDKRVQRVEHRVERR